MDTRTLYIETMNILEKAESLGTVKTFIKALHLTGMSGVLGGGGPFTVFAPSDDAFYRLPVIAVKDMMNDRAALREFVEYHVLPQRKVKTAEAALMQPYTTMQGHNIFFNKLRGGLMVDDVDIIQPDIECSNGVIHVIDALLSPKRAVGLQI